MGSRLCLKVRSTFKLLFGKSSSLPWEFHGTKNGNSFCTTLMNTISVWVKPMWPVKIFWVIRVPVTNWNSFKVIFRFYTEKSAQIFFFSTGNPVNGTCRMGHLHYKHPICPLFLSWVSKRYLREDEVQSAFHSCCSAVFGGNFVLSEGWVQLY